MTLASVCPSSLSNSDAGRRQNASHDSSILAKRAYLQTILSPPVGLAPAVGPSAINIKPYNGADAQV
jgi:hypothetical protein